MQRVYILMRQYRTLLQCWQARIDDDQADVVHVSTSDPNRQKHHMHTDSRAGSNEIFFGHTTQA